MVAVGAALILVCGGFLTAANTAGVPQDWEVQVVLLAAFLPAAVGIHQADRYYSRRLGQVHSLSPASPWTDPLHWLIILGMPVALRVANGAAVVVAVWGVHWFRIVLRDWPDRAHYLFGVAAAAMAVAMTAGNGPSNSGKSSLWASCSAASGVSQSGSWTTLS